MSSRGRRDGGCGFAGVYVGREGPGDFVADTPTERSNCLGLGVTSGHPLGQVRRAWARPLELGDGDPVQGDVELAVTTSVEPMADGITRPDGHGCCAVVPGERGPGAEATDPSSLADELGRGQVTAGCQRD